MGISRRAKRKAAVAEMLLSGKLDEVRDLARRRATVAGNLIGLLSELDHLLRWRAIEALGWVVADLAGDDPQVAKVHVRRQLWTMGEESGGTAWHAPEAVGEMLYRVPALAGEFTSVLAGFGHDEPYEAGVLWAMGRLAHGPGREGALHFGNLVHMGLTSDAPARRGYAAVAAGELNLHQLVDHLRPLLTDDTEVVTYDFDKRDLATPTVAQLANTAFSKLRDCRKIDR